MQALQTTNDDSTHPTRSAREGVSTHSETDCLTYEYITCMNHTIGRRSINLEGLTFDSGSIGNEDNSLTEGVLNSDTLGNFLQYVAPTCYRRGSADTLRDTGI